MGHICMSFLDVFFNGTRFYPQPQLSVHGSGMDSLIKLWFMYPIIFAWSDISLREIVLFFPLCRAYRCVHLATHMRTLYFWWFCPLRVPCDVIWRQWLSVDLYVTIWVLSGAYCGTTDLFPKLFQVHMECCTYIKYMAMRFERHLKSVVPSHFSSRFFRIFNV